MTVGRRKSSRSLAFVTALMTVFALAIPLGSIALASHSGTNDNQHRLEVTPETDSNPTGTTHTLTATVDGPCPAPGCEIDFEIESGPATRVNVTGDQAQGGTANNDGDTPTSPDMTCTIQDPARTCTVTFTSDTAGTNVVRAWVDDDRDNATVDADRTEGADAGEGPDEPAGGTNAPGSRTEPDDTDVVTKTWFGQVAQTARLECTPETATNPSTGEGSSEVYTCVLYNDANQNEIRDAGEQVIQGVAIDGENLGGPNDPDTNRGANDPADAGVPPNTGTADYNDCGTTDANGTAQCTVFASEAQAGTANICFWADNDNDNVYDPAGNEANDGGFCDTEPRDEGTTTGGGGTDANDDDLTDVVAKTWQARGVAAAIDCSPETDQNVRGTQHTVTCVVTDAFGDPVQGALVDFEILAGSRNAGRETDNATTNAQGVAVFTYTDADTPLVTEGEADTIEGCLDPDNAAGCEPNSPQEVAEDEVQKFWFTTLPVAADVIIDMLTGGTAPATEQTTAGPGGTADCNNTDVAADKTATNPNVPDAHLLCAQVLNANNQPIAGQEVTFTTTLGQFFVDANDNQTLDNNEQLAGQTFTTNTDTNGEAFATLYSQQTGTATVTATSGNQSDTGTKIFQTEERNARNIDCTPEEATNAPGTDHVITCVVTDRFGNPVPGVEVDFTETGPGRITNEDDVTNANGVAEAIVSSTVNEEGTQTVTGLLEVGAAGGAFARSTQGGTDDACEQPAGSTSGAEGGPATGQEPAPAGNCEDEVAKTWGGPPPPTFECNDGIDNDGDGLIDFPDDPGCESATDDDESDFPTQRFGGERGQLVQEGACAGFLTGSVQADPDGEGAIIVGTNGADALVGTEAGDLICALDDDDAVQGLGGNDTIFGGGGKDGIEAGLGDDTVFGEGDKDVILGDDGNDELDGGQGNDNMSGGGGADVLLGRGGWDTLKGNAGDDLLVGAKGRDILQGGGGNDTVRGGADDDVLKGYIGNDVLRGGGGDDIIKGSAGRDRLFGNAGDDILNGGPGKDRCRGGRGRDIKRNCP